MTTFYSQCAEFRGGSVACDCPSDCLQAALLSFTPVSELSSSTPHAFDSTGAASFYNYKL